MGILIRKDEIKRQNWMRTCLHSVESQKENVTYDAPTRSAVFNLVFGDPSGGVKSKDMNAVEPVVAARCLFEKCLRQNLDERMHPQGQLICLVPCIDL